MSKSNTLSPIDLYKEVERLYLKERYADIIEFESDYLSLESSELDSEKLRYLAEMFARAYINLNLQEKKPGLTRQYKMGLSYANLGGNDSDILNWKLSLEEALFMRYVKVNRFILFSILTAVLLENLDLLPSAYDFLPFLTAVAVVWYLLNYVMNCRVKRFYLKLIRLIYS